MQLTGFQITRLPAVSSLTTEYPANGSFFRPHTRSVHGDYRVLGFGIWDWGFDGRDAFESRIPNPESR